jgi:hypothetical protein
MGEQQMLEMLSNNPNQDNTRQHYLSPLIVFDDSASANNLGQLTAQPILLSTGNICGKLRRSPLSWLLAGILPAYPKSSKEGELDKCKELIKLNYLKFYQACVAKTIQDIFEMEKNEDGFIVYIHMAREKYDSTFICVLAFVILQDKMISAAIIMPTQA